MSAHTPPRTPRARRPSCLPVGWSVPSLIAVAVVAFLASSPLVSATYTVGASPPFQGVEPVLYTTINTVGCHSRADFLLAPRVNATTGEVHERLRASSRYCAGATVGPDYALVAGFPGFYGPNFTVPASGSYTATFEWAFTYSAALNASGPVNTGSPTSSATAMVSIFTYGYLYDSTNSTVLDGSGGGPFALFHEIHEGSWSQGAVRDVVTLKNSFNLVTGHLYYFETVLLTETEAFAYVAGSAWARLNLGSHGDHARLLALELTGS
jgi:hypothetical protein